MNFTKIVNNKRVLSEDRSDYHNQIIDDILDKYVEDDYDELKARVIARITDYFFKELNLTLYLENPHFNIEELCVENHVFSVQIRSKKTKLKQNFVLKFLKRSNDLYTDTKEEIEFNSNGRVGSFFWVGNIDSCFSYILENIRRLYGEKY